MPAVIKTTLGTRTATDYTVSSITTNGSYGWNLNCSTSIGAEVKVGDKVEYPKGGGVYYRLHEISGSTMVVRKYFGQAYTGQADPSGTGTAATSRAFSQPNGAGGWNNSAPDDLTTPSVEGETGVVWMGLVCKDDAYGGTHRILVTTSVTISSDTSSSTCYKVLTAAPGDSWQELLSTSRLGGDVSGAGFQTNANASIMFTATENYSMFENLTWVAGGTSYTSACVNMTGTSTVIRNCYFNNKNQSGLGSGHIITLSGSNCVFINNFVMLDGATNTATDRIVSLAPQSTGTGNRVYCLGNTFFRPSDRASAYICIRRATASTSYYATLIGNAFLGDWAGLFSSSSGPVIDECTHNCVTFSHGSTDYTDRFPGTNHKYLADISGTWSTANNVIVNAATATADMRAVSGGVLANNSTRITSPDNPVGSVVGGPTRRGGTADVDGVLQTRSTTTPWIGAWETFSGGGGAVAAKFMSFIMRSKK